MANREILLGALGRTRFGELTLVTPDGASRTFAGREPGEHGTMRLKDWGAVDAILKRGDIGLGESYMAGQWESPDLKAFLTFCQRNRDELARVTRFDLVNRAVSRLATLTSHNSLTGSRKNISASYDYPPELYQAYTDRMMTYSSGWWDDKEMSLEEAQINKYNRILDRIGEEDFRPQVMEQVLRTQTQAYYGPENVGHFGLLSGGSGASPP
jgi:cyclopropane-fatty-acyl-phospholipid synthase